MGRKRNRGGGNKGKKGKKGRGVGDDGTTKLTVKALGGLSTFGYTSWDEASSVAGGSDYANSDAALGDVGFDDGLLTLGGVSGAGGAAAATGSSASAARGVDRVVDGSGALRDALTLLEEKRATTRERALRDALKLLRRRPPLLDPLLAQCVQGRVESMTVALLQSIKRGGPREQILACKLLAALAIYVGPDCSRLYELASPSGGILQTVALGDSCIPVRAAALRAMAVVCFVCATDHAATIECIGICVELLSRLHTTAPFFPVDTGEEDKGSRIAVAAAAAAAAASAAAEADQDDVIDMVMPRSVRSLALAEGPALRAALNCWAFLLSVAPSGKQRALLLTQSTARILTKGLARRRRNTKSAAALAADAATLATVVASAASTSTTTKTPSTDTNLPPLAEQSMANVNGRVEHRNTDKDGDKDGDHRDVASEGGRRLLLIFSYLLRHPSLEVRVASGETIAMLLEDCDGADSPMAVALGLARDDNSDSEEEDQGVADGNGGGGDKNHGSSPSRTRSNSAWRRDSYDYDYGDDDDDDYYDEDEEEEEEEEESDDELEETTGSVATSSSPSYVVDVPHVSLINLFAQLKGLATEYNRRISRKERKQQRQAFRTICRSILSHIQQQQRLQQGRKDDEVGEDNGFEGNGNTNDQYEEPIEVIKVANEGGDLRGGFTHDVTSWGEVKQLKLLRETLSGGFQAHLLHNPVLADIFGLRFAAVARARAAAQDGGEDVQRMNAVQRRMYLSKNSYDAKELTQRRGKDRDRKRRQKQAFMD